MTSPKNGRIAPSIVTTLLLGASVFVTGCAPGSADLDDEPVAESSQGLVGQWEWNDVPGTACNNGSQTGFAVNPGTSGDVLIYLEGGGFCWDANTCSSGIASHTTTGYDGAKFASNPPRTGIFDRANPGNPYKNSTIVYVPYCTGDFHSGDAIKGSLHFKGRVNLALDIARFKSAYPAPSRVTLSGSSAGGFGSLFNYDTVAQTFAGTRVDLVTDSAPVLWYSNTSTGLTNMGTWNAWTALPADCTTCRSTPRDLYRFLSTKYPSSRFAYVGFEQDPTMSLAYSVLPVLYAEELRKLANNTLFPLPNWKYFIAPGMKHTTMYNIDVTTRNKRCSWIFGMCVPTAYGETTSLATFLTKMYTDDPTWAKQSSLAQ